MRDFPQILLQIQRDLQSAGVDWCLIGGLAVAARREPRSTKDIDLAVATRYNTTAIAISHKS